MSRKIISVSGALLLATLIAWPPLTASAASMTLQTANNTTGNQAYSGVGVRFDVNSAISVLELGIYDSDQDGIAAPPAGPLSAYLLTSVGGVVAFRTFDITSQGALEDKYRFKSITPVVLLPGTYVLAGYGWTGDDPMHNCFYGGLCETFNNGGGLLTYLDSPFGGGGDPAGTLPTIVQGPTNFFSSANMKFDDATTIPEPATLLLLGSGLAGLGATAWFRRRS